jgi:hypothetical protein
VPSVFSCTQREEFQAISFRKKGYSESSKTFQIDTHGQRQIEIRRDVSLEEETVFQRSIESQMDIDSNTIDSPSSGSSGGAGMILGAKFRSWANFLWFFQK